MTEPFVGEIRQVAFPFAPYGWALCDGAELRIAQYSALYSVLGIAYGGNGTTSFNLPDLRGRFVSAAGQGPGLSRYSVGASGGAANVALTNDQMPAHVHVPQAVSSRGDREDPSGATWAQPHYGRGSEVAYAKGEPTTTMSPQALSPTGSGLPHNNMPPYQVLNYVIALQGIYPTRS